MSNEISDIAIISYHSPPLLGSLESDLINGSIGGMSSDIAQLAVGLDGLGKDVTVLTSSRVDTDETLEEITGRNIHLVQIPTGEPTSDKNKLRERRPQLVEGVLDYYALHGGPNIIYSNYWLSFTAADALRVQFGVPIVHKFHTVEAMKEIWVPDSVIDSSRILEEKEIARRADGIVESTHAGFKDLSAWGVPKDKIHVVSPGFNPDIFNPQDKPAAKRRLELPIDEYAIVAAGRSDPLKNYHVLVQALGELKNDKSTLYLVGVGSHDAERLGLVELAKELGIKDKVKFIPRVNPEELASWYRAADVVVMPSQHETFGMVALEAMACGTPVIASNVGGLPYIVERGATGYLIEPNNPGAIAEHLDHILGDSNQRAIMRLNARILAPNYQLSRTTPVMVRVFEQVLSEYSQKALQKSLVKC